MKGDAWVGLFQRIPAEYHDSLVVALGTGSEVVLQSVVALEPDYMVVRGRTAGSTDGGRVYVVPFAQVVYVGFNRPVSEAELRGIFGADAPAFAGPPAAAPAPAAEPAQADGGTPEPAAAPAAKKLAQVSKSILLARLRARLAQQEGKPPAAP